MPLFERQKLVGYQRWEMPSFDAPTGVIQPPSPPVVETTGLPELPHLPTAVELEQVHQQAEEEGHRSGYQVGYQVGYEEGRQQVTEQVSHWRGMVEALQQQMVSVDQVVIEAMLDLSLEVARQMVRQTVQVNPDYVLAVIREALVLLPHFNQAAHVILNPEDAALVRQEMGEQLSHGGWKISEEERMERGSCRLDTAHSQIDASLEHRWKTVVATLGRDNDWLRGYP